jgi:hypothetical protein
MDAITLPSGDAATLIFCSKQRLGWQSDSIRVLVAPRCAGDEFFGWILPLREFRFCTYLCWR